MFSLSFVDVKSEVQHYIAFDREVDAFNQRHPAHHLYIVGSQPNLGETQMQRHFAFLDSITTAISEAKGGEQVKPMLIQRAVAYSGIQNFDSAIDDLSTLIQMDSTSNGSLAYWLRAVCQARINEFHASQGTNIELKSANVLSDLSQAIQRAPQNAYLYYNRGNLFAQRKDYPRAVDDYTRAIELDRNMAEAWYNRGLVNIYANRMAEGISDLSKAGELGLYTAYSVIKKYREK
jgi:tetratricopeptide (TPR) repeat protein